MDRKCLYVNDLRHVVARRLNGLALDAHATSNDNRPVTEDFSAKQASLRTASTDEITKERDFRAFVPTATAESLRTVQSVGLSVYSWLFGDATAVGGGGR